MSADAPDQPTRRRPTDEAVVAAAVKVLLARGTVESQRRLWELVVRELKRQDPAFAVGPARVRTLVLRSGLVNAEIKARIKGVTGDLAACPVCRSKLARTSNRTLAGATTALGYRCTRCAWWTGRDLREPHRYVFHAKLERRAKQAVFRGSRQVEL
ncbi:MAG TPA: hypothetical protein VM889_11035 [Candidatus Thermoplasmatota archaeon]|nr:hypothetical protein [Candidatus Thermoplasmatota archaeon]